MTLRLLQIAALLDMDSGVNYNILRIEAGGWCLPMQSTIMFFANIWKDAYKKNRIALIFGIAIWSNLLLKKQEYTNLKSKYAVLQLIE